MPPMVTLGTPRDKTLLLTVFKRFMKALEVSINGNIIGVFAPPDGARFPAMLVLLFQNI